MKPRSQVSAAADAGAFRVALVCMPFCMADRPSVQLGLLSAIAREAGFPTDTYHLNLELAALIPDAYGGLCSHRGRMTGEWLFSIAAFGDKVPPDDALYFDAFPEELGWAAKGGKDAAYLSALRHDVLPRFIDSCLESVDWGSYEVIGFTSTFQQNVASLALARRIKERHPEVSIVFGGANMEDEMGPEYARVFPFIDYIVVGEGDLVFPELLRRLARGESPAGMPGVVFRDADGIVNSGQAPPVLDLDLLPTPSYDEYFERARCLGLAQRPGAIFALPFESSRGCWWGAKHHCTFCGLNGLGMAFRAKSPTRVLAELGELMERYRSNMFQATDNIMDMKYVTQLFTRIADARSDYQFFYEVKANLTREQLRLLRSGGMRWIQPGIASLSTHVLQLMRKGCTMLQNVRLLKWALYYRLRVGWNLIWGFPGETAEDYRRELQVIKLLSHLEPPNACGRIWMERFSPVFTDRASFPGRLLSPEPSYAAAYPQEIALDKIAYFFEYELQDTSEPEVHRPTNEWVDRWKAEWHSEGAASLFSRRSSDMLFIDEARIGHERGTYSFAGPMASAYEFCGDTMHTAEQVAEHLCASAGGRYGDAEIEAALDEFCQRGLMLEEDGKYLSLAIPVNPNW
jgi:ribosomal peptide maturation radical SAM protein 1